MLFRIIKAKEAYNYQLITINGKNSIYVNRGNSDIYQLSSCINNINIIQKGKKNKPLQDGINKVEDELDISKTTVTISLDDRYRKVELDISSCASNRALDPNNDKKIGKRVSLNLPTVIGGSVGGVFIILIMGLVVHRRKKWLENQKLTQIDTNPEYGEEYDMEEDYEDRGSKIEYDFGQSVEYED